MNLLGVDLIIFMCIVVFFIETFPSTKTPISYLGCASVYMAIKYLLKLKSMFDLSLIERKFSVDVKNSITKKENALIINIDGKQIFVPFSRSFSRKQIGKRYFFVTKEGVKQEFKPYHGVPLLVKPSDIGCDHISVTNEMDDSQENFFDKND